MAMTEPAADACWICRERPIDAGAPPVLALPPSLCTSCGLVTRPYDTAWDVLSAYLMRHWKDIVRRGSFDLSHALGGDAPIGARQTHLFFVKLLGSKLRTDRVRVDLARFADALITGIPHPEVTLLIADCTAEGRRLLYYDADVSVLKRDDEIYSAVWMHLAFPVAVKVCYLAQAAPVQPPEGFPWHPTRQRKIVKLSPYRGDTRPIHARRDLRL